MADDDDQKGGAGAGNGTGDDDAGKKNDGAGDGGNGGDGDGKGGGKPEPQVPLSRLREETAKREKLEKELADARGGGKKDIPEDEKKIRDVMSRARKEEVEAEKQAQKELTEKLDELHKVHGDFSNENLLKIIEDYGCYNEDGTVRWDKAMELYNRLGGNPNAPAPKKKTPAGGRTEDDIKDKPFDPSKQSMWEIADEAKRSLR